MDRLIILFATAIILNSITLLTAEHGDCPSVFSCKNCTSVRLCKPKYGHTGYFEFKSFECGKLTHPFCDPQTGSCISTPKTEECLKIKKELCQTIIPQPDYCKNNRSDL